MKFPRALRNKVDTYVRNLASTVISPFTHMNWWQMNGTLPSTSDSTAVAACVSIYADEVGRTTFHHYKTQTDGSQVILTDSVFARIVRKPNQYQTWHDFKTFITRSIFYHGWAYAYAVRDGAGRITRLLPLSPNSCAPYITDDGEVFYRISKDPWNDAVDNQADQYYPARDIWHPRINCKTHPLLGVSPITAAILSVETGYVIQQQNRQFFQNMSRVSGILSTPLKMNKDILDRVQTAFASKSSGEGVGKVPVLDSDLKFYPMGMTAVDSELVRVYKQSLDDIAMIFRIPKALLGVTDGAAYKNTETLMRTFVNMGLGALFSNLEQSLTELFDLPPGETIKADIEEAILRTDLKERIEALVRGVQGGVFSPNEARKVQNLPPKEGGDEIFLQQQMVPVAIAVKGPQEPEPPAPQPEPPDVETDEEAATRYLRYILAEAA